MANSHFFLFVLAKFAYDLDIVSLSFSVCSPFFPTKEVVEKSRTYQLCRKIEMNVKKVLSGRRHITQI